MVRRERAPYGVRRPQVTRHDRTLGLVAHRDLTLPLGSQPCRQREGDLTAARAGSHHHHVPTVGRCRHRQRGLDLGRCNLDRLHHRDGRAVGDAVRCGRLRADVERQKVIRQGRTRTEVDQALRRIDADNAVIEKRRAGARRQRPHVDLRVAQAILAREHPRHHAGIRRIRVRRDDGEAQAGLAAHRQRLEHVYMRVAATGENEVLQARQLHRVAALAAAAAEFERYKPSVRTERPDQRFGAGLLGQSTPSLVRRGTLDETFMGGRPPFGGVSTCSRYCSRTSAATHSTCSVCGSRSNGCT